MPESDSVGDQKLVLAELKERDWPRLDVYLELVQRHDHPWFAPGTGNPEYYQRVLATQQAIFLSPWLRPLGDDFVPVISVVVPIFVKQRFVGIAGVDLRVQVLQDIIDRQSADQLAGGGGS